MELKWCQFLLGIYPMIIVNNLGLNKTGQWNKKKTQHNEQTIFFMGTILKEQ